MGARLEELAAWGLPPMLMRFARGDLPHSAFETLCEEIQYEKRRSSWDLRLDRVQTLHETGNRASAALWEHDVRDGHAFSVVYCSRTESAFEFWEVMYADDMPGPTSSLLARSEQGLFFWLFFFVIQSEFSEHGEGAYSTLAAAAKSVNFKYLVEVFRLEGDIGSDDLLDEKLRERSLMITS